MSPDNDSEGNLSSLLSHHDENSIFGDSDNMGQELIDPDASDVNIDNKYFDDEAYLYPGCEKATDVAILELLEIHFNNSITKTALKDFLKFYVSSLPSNHNMPCTVHTVFQYVENLSIPVREIAHYFFYTSMHLLKSKQNHCNIDSCHSTDVKVFYELPIERQIRFLFEHRGLADVIDKYQKKRSSMRGKICDVADGTEYVRMWRGVAAIYKITLILNRKKRLRRFIYKENPAPLRTHDSIMNEGIFVLRHGLDSKRGIKGLTITRKLPGCDLCNIVMAEYTHSVLEKVVLQFCTMWFYVRGDWYIGNHLTEINNFLC